MPSRKRSTSIKKRLSMLKFSVDDLVFAKHRNLLDWPGKILALPEEEDGKKYKVLLYGIGKEIASPEKNLSNFQDSYAELGCPTDNDERNKGLWEALFDPCSLGLQKPQNLAAVLLETFECRENFRSKDLQKQSITPTSSGITASANGATTSASVKEKTETIESKRSSPTEADVQLKVGKQSAEAKNRKKPLAELLPLEFSSSPSVNKSAASTNSLGTPRRSSSSSTSATTRRSALPLTPLLSPTSSSTKTTTPVTPITPAGRRATCLALKVPNNTPLSPPKSKRTTRGLKRCSQEPQDALNDVSLFMEKIQALEQKQKTKRRSK